jgi:hypothetical protein
MHVDVDLKCAMKDQEHEYGDVGPHGTATIMVASSTSEDDR